MLAANYEYARGVTLAEAFTVSGCLPPAALTRCASWELDGHLSYSFGLVDRQGRPSLCGPRACLTHSTNGDGGRWEEDILPSPGANFTKLA